MTGEREGLAAIIDAILREFPMSDDGTGHIADCGFDANDERCDCSTLRQRLADLLAARDRRVRGEALREAAADWPREVNAETIRREIATLDLRETPPEYRVDQWLRDRAGRIEAP